MVRDRFQIHLEGEIAVGSRGLFFIIFFIKMELTRSRINLNWAFCNKMMLKFRVAVSCKPISGFWMRIGREGKNKGYLCVLQHVLQSSDEVRYEFSIFLNHHRWKTNDDMKYPYVLSPPRSLTSIEFHSHSLISNSNSNVIFSASIWSEIQA